MLFIKYITDKYGNSTDFAPPVTIPKGASFKDMVALMGKQKDGGWTCDLTPKPLIVARYFAKEQAAVQGELDRVSQTLTGRIRELADRYATPLPQLPFEVAALAARVDEHLKKMAATP